MSKLYAGFARADISPLESVPLAGFGNTSRRLSDSVSEPLYANVLALGDDGGNTALVAVLDMGNMYPPLPSFRQDVADSLGLPREKGQICCTHSHSAPHISNDEIDTIPRYCKLLREKLLESAAQAMADRREATLTVAAVETEGLNFVRRYVMVDGSYAGDNYGNHKLGYAGHESEPDRVIQVVRFAREGAKDIVMANFQGHPHRASGAKKLNCTSDLVYWFRKELEDTLDCHALYFSGASGNVNCHSRIAEENIYPDYITHGKALARYALDALKAQRPVAAGPVQTHQKIYVGRCNHTEDHKVEQARTVVARWKAGAKNKESLIGYEDLFNSPYHASSVISKAQRPETMDVELNAIRFGGVSMVFAPFELFCDLGADIKAGSPFDMTFVCCYANRIFSYMPTQLGFDHGGYGPNQCRFMPGTGEILVEEFGQMLRALQ